MMQEKLENNAGVRFDVSGKLPHKDDMLLISGIARKDGDIVRLPLTLPPGGNIFTRSDNVVAPLAMIEMLAQLCGAQHTFDRGITDGHLNGYLMGIDKVEFHEPIYVGDTLELAAWKIFELKEIKRVKGEIHRGGRLVGRAELTLFEVDDWIPGRETTGGGQLPGNVNDEYISWARNKDAVARGIVESIRNIEIRSDESVEAVLCFQPGFVGFSGHFRGNPVLPGVVMIYTGWLLAQLCFKKELDLYSITRAKFAEPVYPFDMMNLEMKSINRDDEPGGEYSVIVR
jgi:3-hydroxymyristoyl/3-hydroxydecanoyl-(acyl carrier protein) dehydratase